MYSEEESPGIFKDLKISVYSKAFSLSSNPVIIDVNTSIFQEEQKINKNKDVTSENCAGGSFDLSNSSLSSPLNCDTPKSKSRVITMVKGSLLKQQMLHQDILKKNDSSSNLFPTVSEESSFTPQKLLQFYDKQRCLTVEKVMMERIQNMQQSNKLIHDNLGHKWQAEQEEVSARRLLLEQNILDSIHEQEMKNRPKREAQLVEDNMKSAQRVLERIQRVKNAEIEARKKCEDLSFYRKCRDKILDCQKEYNQEYKDIQALLSSCENKELLSEKNNNTVKELKNLFTKYEDLLKKIKSTDLTNKDVNSFVKLVDTAKELHKNLAKDVETINVEVKKAKDIEMEKLTKEEPSKVSTVEASDDHGFSDCFDSKSLQTYVKLKTYLENFENSCKALAEDNTMKSFRFNCQKAVTIPVNAISPISSAHLLDKYQKLYNLLSGKLVDVGGVKICASQHSDGVTYCKKLLAKKFVRQGDLTVSSKPDAAFSIAAILVSLWIDFPDFGQLTLAYFQNSCPYLAPVFLPQIEGQSVEEYHKSLGYHYTQSGEVEKQDSFLKRMSGIMRLYAAVLISKPRQPGKQNPLGISEGWRWIAALLNLEPRPDICATLLYDFLVVAGNEMFRVYGAQFKKLLAYICQEYFPRLEKVTPASSGGPIVRLEGFLQKVMKNGSIPPPEALLPANFW